MQRVVIVGNGIAGTMVASKLRALEPDPQKLAVSIYTREPFDYYARIRLPEIFASTLGAQDLEIYKPGWYASKQIEVFKNQEVVKLDPGARRIFTRDGGSAAYESLVLCTGAESWKPPIRNVDLDGIFTIREYGDADAIRRYIGDSTRHAVVVGGGLLGLEAAKYLLGPGVDTVTIVEIMDRLLPRQLDAEGSRMLLGLIEEPPRCRVVLGAEVRAFIGDARGRVSGLSLADGRELPAQTVLISAGIAPRVSLAREAGLQVRKGVIVDEHLRTSVPGIWAAGDIAEYQRVVWGIVPAALEHAPVAAASILGRPGPAYRQTIPQNTLKVAGVTLTSFGRVDLEDGQEPGVRVIARSDSAAGRYEKYVLVGGVLAGCILLGSRANQTFAAQRMGKPAAEEEIRSRLW